MCFTSAPSHLHVSFFFCGACSFRFCGASGDAHGASTDLLAPIACEASAVACGAVYDEQRRACSDRGRLVYGRRSIQRSRAAAAAGAPSPVARAPGREGGRQRSAAQPRARSEQAPPHAPA